MSLSIVEEYERKRREFEALPIREQTTSPLRDELTDMYSRYVAARDELRLQEAEAQAKAAEAQAEAERLAMLPRVYWIPPPMWVRDGSYSILPVAAQRVILPLYSMLNPGGRRVPIFLDQIARLCGCSEATAKRGVAALVARGWIRRLKWYKRGQLRTWCFFCYPKPGLLGGSRTEEGTLCVGGGQPARWTDKRERRKRWRGRRRRSNDAGAGGLGLDETADGGTPDRSAGQPAVDGAP